MFKSVTALELNQAIGTWTGIGDGDGDGIWDWKWEMGLETGA